MEETLKQILFELKELRAGQAALEKTSTKNRDDIVALRISNISREKNQAILEQGLSRINERLGNMQLDMGETKERLGGMQLDMAEIKACQTQVAITQENEVLPRIQLVLEGHSGLVDRIKHLEELPDQIEDIQTNVSVLKHVFKEHVHS